MVFSGTVQAATGATDYEYINAGPFNPFRKLQHRPWVNSFYTGGSINYPVAGASSILSGPSTGGNPYLRTFSPNSSRRVVR
jgi:hypothetical protein